MTGLRILLELDEGAAGMLCGPVGTVGRGEVFGAVLDAVDELGSGRVMTTRFLKGESEHPDGSPAWRVTAELVELDDGTVPVTATQLARLRQLCPGPLHTRPGVDYDLERAGLVACHWVRTGHAGRTTSITPAGVKRVAS